MTRLYPGPLATMLMGDLGADVIKVEDLNSPDYMRLFPPFIGEESAGYLCVNRAKRSFACNLRDERGKNLFFKLVQRSDVVVEQFRPGVMAQMGLHHEAALSRNPGIIYVSLTGYGQEGPYSGEASHDLNYIGYAGILDITGTSSEPIIPGLQIADIAGGSYMAIIATLSALWFRQQTGQGQHVDVAMLDGVLPLLSLQMAHHWAGERSPRGQTILSGGMPSYGVYECSDGRFIALAALEEKFWKNFCHLTGREDWLDLLYDPDAKEELRSQMKALFKTKTRDQWAEMARSKDVCLTPVLSLAELENDPHIKARRMIIGQYHPSYGNIKGIGMPIKFSRSQPALASPPPVLAEHTREILKEIGYSDKEIRHLKEEKVVEIP